MRRSRDNLNSVITKRNMSYDRNKYCFFDNCYATGIDLLFYSLHDFHYITFIDMKKEFKQIDDLITTRRETWKFNVSIVRQFD